MVDACLSRLPGARRLLDLGGGHGEFAMEFARRGQAVTMQDRPEVVAIAEERGRVAAAGVQLFAGDFFEELPAEEFDVVFCSGVTHTYDEARNLRLFEAVRSLLAPGGTLVIATLLRHRAPAVDLFAVQMLMVSTGGDTHAEEDYRRWLAEAGYGQVELAEVVPESTLRPPSALLFARP